MCGLQGLEAGGPLSFQGKGRVVALPGHGLVQQPLRGRASRPQLKRDPLGSSKVQH